MLLYWVRCGCATNAMVSFGSIDLCLVETNSRLIANEQEVSANRPDASVFGMRR